jgi:hypothetical protein
MARIPLVVSVECDVEGCEEGVIIHGRGEGIGLKRLRSHLEQDGWTFRPNANPDLGEDDICPACSRRREVKEKREHGQPDQEGAPADH